MVELAALVPLEKTTDDGVHGKGQLLGDRQTRAYELRLIE